MHIDEQSTMTQVPDEAPLAPASDTADTPAAPLGHVFSVGGSHVLVRFSPEVMSGESAADLTVGAFLGIWTRHSLAVGVLADISSEAGTGAQAVGRVDLLGEIVPSASGPARFERGVRSYPTIGNRVVPVGHAGLRIIFDLAGANMINVGELQQDREIGAYINVDDMVRKHFALLGSTGAGK
jgi:hypothetical protein